MGSSTKKTTFNQTTNGNSVFTTSPNTPGYAQEPASDYYQMVGNLGNQLSQNLYDFNTPANGLQQLAYDTALNKMGGWRQGLGQSNSLAMGAAQSSVPAVNAATYYAPTIANAGRPSVANQLPTQQATATGYSAPTLGPAAQAQATNAGAASLGPAAQASVTNAQAANAGSAAQAGLSQAQAAQAGPAASLLDNFAAYANPITNELVDANLSAFDQSSAEARNAMEAAAAKNRAFGGSGYAVQQAQFDADNARNRALTSAELRSNAFNQQANLANTDAARRQETSLFNTGNQQQTNLANMAAANQANQFNTGQSNQFALTNSGYKQQANLQNAQAETANSQFNTNQTNQQNQLGAQLGTQAGIANAANATQVALANANSQNARDLAQAGFAADAGQFGANALNQASLFNAGQQNTANQSLFDALNNANMAEFQGRQSNNQLQANLAAQAGQFNANSLNNMGQFNAGLQENALARQLSAAGLLSDNANTLGANQRADLGAQLDIGNSRYDLDRANQYAPFTNLAALGSLIDPSLLAQLSGQTVSGQEYSNMYGTGTEKSSGGALGAIGGLLGGLGGLATGLGGMGLKFK